MVETCNLFDNFNVSFFLNVAEHMLFYASEKYPVEDSYSKFIAEVLTFLLVNFAQLCILGIICGTNFELFVFLFVCLVSMVVLLMRSHHQRIPTSILILMPTVWRNP
jgi:hypothetical protein